MSEPSATVTLSFVRTTGTIVLHVDGNGLVPGAPYQFQLRHGGCLTPTSNPLVTFQTMVADSRGAAKTDVAATEPRPSGIPKGIYIDLHLLQAQGTALVPEALSSACTDVPPRFPTKALGLFAPPALKAGGKVTARYLDGRTLSLHFELLALKPSSVHAIHIHEGSCGAAGHLVYKVADLTVDSLGSVSATRIIHFKQATGTWYVEIHTGPSRTVDVAQPDPIDAQPVLCGDLSGVSRPKHN